MGSGRLVLVSQTPTITAGAYTANDALGGLLTFANVVDPDTRTGRIVLAQIIDKAGQSAATDIFLFDATFTATADNAAFPTTSPTEAFIGTNCIGLVSVAAADYKAYSGGSVAVVQMDRRLVLPTTTLYAQAVTRGTPTYAATSDIIIRLTVERD